MSKSSYNKLADSVQMILAGALLVQAIFVVSGTIIALSYSSDDCENPIRAWLIVHSCISAFLFLLYFCLKKTTFAIWVIWNITFSIAACIWTFGDSGCSDSFSYGFTAVSLMASTSLMLLFLILLSGCIAGIAACIGFGLMSNYEPID